MSDTDVEPAVTRRLEGGALGSPAGDATEPHSNAHLRNTLKTELQLHHAAIHRLIIERAQHESEIKRLKRALEAMGECPDAPNPSRCEVLRDYLLDHPEEEVTTKSLASTPEKYGIITSARKLQLNWLYGRNNPTARRFFEVSKGLIRLRPGITRQSTPS